MISEHFVVLDHHRGPAFGSDHYPVTATVALR
jgi:endonuclease/exonuclease/phosphatase family metal-dependent hydrolase